MQAAHRRARLQHAIKGAAASMLQFAASSACQPALRPRCGAQADFLFERRLNGHLFGIIREFAQGKPSLIFCRCGLPLTVRALLSFRFLVCRDQLVWLQLAQGHCGDCAASPERRAAEQGLHQQPPADGLPDGGSSKDL